MTLSRLPAIGLLLLMVGLAGIGPALLMGGSNCSVERLFVMAAALIAPPLIGMGLVHVCVDIGSLPNSCRESAGLLLFCLMGEVLFDLSCQVWLLGHDCQNSGLPRILALLLQESVTATGRLAAVITVAGATATLPCAWFAVAARSRYYGYVASLRIVITALSTFMLLQRCGALVIDRLSLVLL